MNLMGLNMMDWVGTLVGFVLTLCIFSWIIADNGLFRLAIHIFVGVSAGFYVVMILYNLIWPQLIVPFFVGSIQDRLLMVIPLILSGLLLTKVFPRLGVLGNPVMAFLVGVGAAAAVGGAILGTIFPQLIASVNLIDPPTRGQIEINPILGLLNAVIILVGTLSTLIYFQFGVFTRKPGSPLASWQRGISWSGQLFIAISLGVLFAGVYTAALTAFVERISSILRIILSFFLPGP
jgi:hypothetical protein